MQDAPIIRSEISLSRNSIVALNTCHIMIWKFGEGGGGGGGSGKGANWGQRNRHSGEKS